jgi:hypothetical protein
MSKRQHLILAIRLAASFYAKALAYDRITGSHTFVMFSRDNPYVGMYNRAQDLVFRLNPNRK